MESKKSVSSLGSSGAVKLQRKRSQDFQSAYLGLVQKLANGQATGVKGLVSEADLQKLEYQKRLEQNQFLERQEFYTRIKDEKLSAQAAEKLEKDYEECTFQPLTLKASLQPVQEGSTL